MCKQVHLSINKLSTQSSANSKQCTMKKVEGEVNDNRKIKRSEQFKSCLHKMNHYTQSQ